MRWFWMIEKVNNEVIVIKKMEWIIRQCDWLCSVYATDELSFRSL